MHNPLPFYLHAYLWPFSIIWPIFLHIFYDETKYDKYIGGSEWTFVWVGTIITAQSLVWLSTNWNINVKSLFTSRQVYDVKNAKLIKVLPVANAGLSGICPIIRDNVRLPWLLPFSSRS